MLVIGIKINGRWKWKCRPDHSKRNPGRPFWLRVVKDVYFANVGKGAPLDPLNPPYVAPPPPPLTGNAMTLATLQQLLTAMVPGSITAAQIAAFQAAAASLVPDAAQPPAGPITLPAWKIVAGDLATYSDEKGQTWKARGWNAGRMALLRNGAYEGITPSEAFYPGTGTTVYVKRADGTGRWWIKWVGTWSYMTAGEVPPGYQ